MNFFLCLLVECPVYLTALLYGSVTHSTNFLRHYKFSVWVPSPGGYCYLPCLYWLFSSHIHSGHMKCRPKVFMQWKRKFWHCGSKTELRNQRRRPLLGNGSLNTFPGQPDHVTATTDTGNTRGMFGTVFSLGSAQRLHQDSFWVWDSRPLAETWKAEVVA